MFQSFLYADLSMKNKILYSVCMHASVCECMRACVYVCACMCVYVCNMVGVLHVRQDNQVARALAW